MALPPGSHKLVCVLPCTLEYQVISTTMDTFAVHQYYLTYVTIRARTRQRLPSRKSAQRPGISSRRV
jgi:hypothetical protein